MPHSPIDPAVLQQAEMREALAWHDIGRVFTLLVAAGIPLAAIHLQAGEADGLGMAEGVIRDVAGLQSMRARQHLAPLADALASRRDSQSRELAVAAGRVAATRV